MVALIGAHTIGFTTRPDTGPVPLSATPFAFNTDFFTKVLARQGVFPSDIALNDDAVRTLPLVQRYATNQAAFFADFAAAYVKVGKMGATWRSYGP